MTFSVPTLFHFRLHKSKPKVGSACLDDTHRTMLGLALAGEAASHPGLSGLYPLADGHDAFAARVMLADAAERSIDVQYYIWRDDTSGRLLLHHLRQASERGVRVRLLLDDNNTKGLEGVLTCLHAPPAMEVRLFNPLWYRHLRVIDYLFDFRRVNRRMHNKSFTVDNQVTVVGGRNVGNEYFGAGEGVMFADLDMLAVGPVVNDVSRDFDRYWNSASAFPLDYVLPKVPSCELNPEAPSDPLTQVYLKALAQSDLVQKLERGTLPLQWAKTFLVSDDPAKVLGNVEPSRTMMGQLREVLDAAQSQLTLVSPYFVPTVTGAHALAKWVSQGVAVSVLTNALSATDVMPVHAGYAKYRKQLLKAGVRLFELKRHATLNASGRRRHHGYSGASLHAKTFALDGSQIFVGSFNMDPRSARLNTEMGLVMECPTLAQQLLQGLTQNSGTHTYEVTLHHDRLRWTTEENGQTVMYDREPLTSWWRRAAVRILSWLPFEWLL